MINAIIKKYIEFSYKMSYKKYKNTPIKMNKGDFTDAWIKNEAIKLNNKWEYIYDPVHGAINLISNPNIDMTSGDCDDFAATMYAKIGNREKYLVHIITKDLTKCHTILICKCANGWMCIDWNKVYKIDHIKDLKNSLAQKYNIRFLDLAAFNEEKKKWYRVKI